MRQNNTTRKSHCSICGKRLSWKAASNTICWQTGYIDDTGIYCDSCNTARKIGKDQGTSHADRVRAQYGFK